jgi:hypothetical protein
VRRATVLFIALFLAACGSSDKSKPGADDPRAGGAAADQSLPTSIDPSYRPANAIVVEREGYGGGRVAFHGDAAFDAAVASFQREAGAQRVPVEGIPGAIGFRVDHKKTQASIERWNREYLRRGAYVFRYANTEGYNGGADGIIVLPTRDKWTVLRAAAVNGVNYDILTPAIVSWLQRLDRYHPFTVYGAGIDFVEGRFTSPPRGQEALALARSMYRFDPDIVDQGMGSVRALAHELESTGTLYLWWD